MPFDSRDVAVRKSSIESMRSGVATVAARPIRTCLALPAVSALFSRSVPFRSTVPLGAPLGDADAGLEARGPSKCGSNARHAKRASFTNEPTKTR